jgi:hypothetical protein
VTLSEASEPVIVVDPPIIDNEALTLAAKEFFKAALLKYGTFRPTPGAKAPVVYLCTRMIRLEDADDEGHWKYQLEALARDCVMLPQKHARQHGEGDVLWDQPVFKVHFEKITGIDEAIFEARMRAR